MLNSSCKLYLITPEYFDPKVFSNHLAAAIDAGNVACVQLRMKNTTLDEVAYTIDILRPIVQDRNKDSSISFSLEIAPEGMYIENGTIIWKTDSAHVEVYDVRIVASDGFERTTQEFQLFSRAGVKILSKASTNASVGKKYS